MARPPKSNALSKRTKTGRKVKGELLVHKDEPPMPDGMNGHAKKMWIRLMDVLGESGQLTLADAMLYEQYCSLWELYQTAMQDVRKHGVTSITATRRSGKGFKQNPSARIALSAIRELRSTGQEIGLSPTGRARLGIAAAIRATQNPAYDHLK